MGGRWGAHRAACKMSLGSLVAGESTALVGDASGIRGRRRGWGSVRWCSASCVLTWRRSRGRRSVRTRRKGVEVAVAASTTAARPWWHSVAVGNEGARCGGSGGGSAGTEARVGGRVGGGTEEARRGDLIPSSSPARGCGGDAPLFRPGSGEQGKGTRCGSWAGWAGQAGCGPGGLGGGRAGGLGCLVQGASPLFLFFCNFFLLFIFPFCFI